MEQFDKVAEVYAKSRPTYPKEVYIKILEWCETKVVNNAVDIACGSGQSIEGLKTFAKNIIGVEPGENLIREAQKKYPGIKILKGSGESIPLNSGTADLVTIANGFYWMDRQVALHEIARVLNQTGSLVLYRYLFPALENMTANEILLDHCKKYWDQFRDNRLTKNDDSDLLIERTRLFSKIDKDIVKNIWTLPVNNFICFLSSTSYVSKYLQSLTVKQQSEYLHSLNYEFSKFAVNNLITINLDIHMVLAKK